MTCRLALAPLLAASCAHIPDDRCYRALAAANAVEVMAGVLIRTGIEPEKARALADLAAFGKVVIGEACDG